jgi:hypothetical protein
MRDGDGADGARCVGAMMMTDGAQSMHSRDGVLQAARAAPARRRHGHAAGVPGAGEARLRCALRARALTRPASQPARQTTRRRSAPLAHVSRTCAGWLAQHFWTRPSRLPPTGSSRSSKTSATSRTWRYSTRPLASVPAPAPPRSSSSATPCSLSPSRHRPVQAAARCSAPTPWPQGWRLVAALLTLTLYVACLFVIYPARAWGRRR